MAVGQIFILTVFTILHTSVFKHIWITYKTSTRILFSIFCTLKLFLSLTVYSYLLSCFDDIGKLLVRPIFMMPSKTLFVLVIELA